MKSIYLFPNKLKIPALTLFLVSCLIIILDFLNLYTLPELETYVFAIVSDDGSIFNPTAEFSSIIKNDVTGELTELMFYIGGIILFFSKEKIEDEIISYIRLKSLVYSTYFAFTLLILNQIFVYGFSAMFVDIFFYHGFLIFLNIFYYTKLFIYKKQFSYENED